MAVAKKKSYKNVLPISLSFILFILTFLTYQIIVLDKFYPLTYLGDVNISLLTPKQAVFKYDQVFNARAQNQLQVVYGDNNFYINLATASAKISYDILYEEFDNAHQGTFWQKVGKQLATLFAPQTITPKISLSLEDQIETIAKVFDKEAENAQLVFDESPTDGTPSARIQIVEGMMGIRVDQDLLYDEIGYYLTYGNYQNQLPTQIIHPKITTEHVQKAKVALEQTLKESIKLKFAGNIFVLDTKQLLALLDLTSGSDLLLDKEKTYVYLQKIASEIDQQVQEGLFEFDPQTKRVSTFKPSREGRKLDVDFSYRLLTQTLEKGTTPRNINLPVTIIKPKIHTSDVNSLGIKELIGRGVSHFAGSIPNRIYNIDLTASKINGVLIPPGETFSFNQTVGDITAATGFKQAYVIKEGRTVLDDGGGVCQDSTTLFRAVLNAGLPVLKRTAHAYRVGYYEQSFPPGLDATVFYPSVDFQFKNDTSAHILIQAYTIGTTLYVDLYGTSDGRVATISKSTVTDQTPPPPDLRQDDPTLPKGTVKQVDWAAQGANVSFIRTVSRGGEQIIKESWKSNYRPWQAVYLVGTKDN